MMLAGLMASVGATAPTGIVTRTLLLTSQGAHSPTPWQAFDGSNLVITDVNGDGLPEIVASNDNLRHYVIDPRLSQVVAELHGSHRGGDTWLGRELDGPAVGDVFGDHHEAIAIDDGDSYVSLWRYSPLGSTPRAYNLTLAWEHYLNTQALDPAFNASHPYNTNDTPASEAHPFLADVDGQGWMTIFAQADNVAAHAAFYPNGTLRWFRDPEVDSNAGGIVADLHGDGQLEAVFASDGGPVYVEDPKTGAALWTYDTRCAGGTYQGDGSNCDWSAVGSVTLSPTVTDLFVNGKKEICFGTRQAYNPNDPAWNQASTLQVMVDASHAKLYCLTDTGTLLWMQQIPFGNPHVAMHPVPFDVNGDGVKDLLWEDWNTIGHLPGNWQTTTRGPNLFALDGRDGHLLWNVTLAAAWSNKDVSLADLFGDGHELLLAEEFGATGDDGVSAFDPHTGARIAWVPLPHGWLATRGPLVASLWGDGRMQIVVPVMRNGSGCPQNRPDLPCREGAIAILCTGVPFATAFDDSFPWTTAPGGTPGRAQALSLSATGTDRCPQAARYGHLAPAAGPLVAIGAAAALRRPTRARHP
ncbi:MAG: FG-GAP repeat domain-containing protein [Thermoplasmatota archaeon]